MTAAIHHIEYWVPDFAAARPRWEWLLHELGWADFQDWPLGHSWKSADGGYLVIEQSAAMTEGGHDRLRPGVNHLALNAASRAAVDALTAASSAHGWALMFPDRHPFAGGTGHYAAYLCDEDGFELEIVAEDVRG
ncbi:VOC family protein [Lacisediminihabitans sp.]|jgi:catechol 2,3-dioxygenase-like lactoylglutathione lyase family enzyme|uniref:VOC family protein n=1 Tax=Lacisediminihabitans sp. TaxID=2787631 RepID=UPI002F9365A8